MLLNPPPTLPSPLGMSQCLLFCVPLPSASSVALISLFVRFYLPYSLPHYLPLPILVAHSCHSFIFSFIFSFLSHLSSPPLSPIFSNSPHPIFPPLPSLLSSLYLTLPPSLTTISSPSLSEPPPPPSSHILAPHTHLASPDSPDQVVWSRKEKGCNQ